jgi:hypothetical protein
MNGQKTTTGRKDPFDLWMRCATFPPPMPHPPPRADGVKNARIVGLPLNPIPAQTSAPQLHHAGRIFHTTTAFIWLELVSRLFCSPPASTVRKNKDGSQKNVTFAMEGR